MVAVVTQKSLRYKRVAKRAERPFNSTEIRERDRSEVENLEKGGPIAMADYYLLNDGSLSDLNENLRKVLAEMDF